MARGPSTVMPGDDELLVRVKPRYALAAAIGTTGSGSSLICSR